MSPAKLSDADKQTLIDLYRETPATTSLLAEQFGVSNSTVSRLLKTALAPTEYDQLIQAKRQSRGTKPEAQLALPLPPTPVETDSVVTLEKPAPPKLEIHKTRRSRSRSGAKADLDTLPPDPPVLSDSRLQVVTVKTPALEQPVPPMPAMAWELDEDFETEALDGELGSLESLEDDFDPLEELEELEKLEELEELEEEEDGGDRPLDPFPSPGDSLDPITVLPFQQAVLPPSCYLVIDRMSELIVRPLKELIPLGRLPEIGGGVKPVTLPVFDNHRVARRFSLRTQRVIKVPDSELFHKTAAFLKAKGITHIFLDGQVYAL